MYRWIETTLFKMWMSVLQFSPYSVWKLVILYKENSSGDKFHWSNENHICDLAAIFLNNFNFLAEATEQFYLKRKKKVVRLQIFFLRKILILPPLILPLCLKTAQSFLVKLSHTHTQNSPWLTFSSKKVKLSNNRKWLAVMETLRQP